MSFTSPRTIRIATICKGNKLDTGGREKKWRINSKREKIARKRGVGELERKLGCHIYNSNNKTFFLLFLFSFLQWILYQIIQTCESDLFTS